MFRIMIMLMILMSLVGTKLNMINILATYVLVFKLYVLK